MTGWKVFLRVCSMTLLIVLSCALLTGLSMGACMGVFSVLYGAGAPLMRSTFAAQAGAYIGGVLGMIAVIRVFLSEWSVFQMGLLLFPEDEKNKELDQ